MVINSIYFIFFVFIFLIIPAKALFKILKINEEDDIIIDFGILILTGLITLILIMSFFRFIKIGFWSVWLLPFISMFYLIKRKSFFVRIAFRSINLKKILVVISVIILGIIAQDIGLFKGGRQIASGYTFSALQDNMWNISILNELTYNFPPQNPAISGAILKNHHYFYHFFLSIIHIITKIHVFDLYYRFGPALTSLLYGIGLYAVGKIFSKNILIQGLIVFFGFFSGNIAHLASLFFGTSFDWKANTFFADQPFDQILNPYTVFGFVVLLFIIYSLYKAINSDRNLHFGWSTIGGLMMGSLYGFKSFGGVVAMLAIIVTVLFCFIRYRTLYFLITLLFSLVIFIPIFLLLTKTNSAMLIWAPGWLLTEMIIGQDKLNLPGIALAEYYYKSINNILGFLKIKLFELIIYIVGNLGTRVVGLVYLLETIIFSGQYDFRKKLINIFILSNILIAFSLPILFNLGNSAYNIIQFTPYALVLLSIYASLWIGKIFYLVYKKGHQIISFLFITIVLLLSLPTSMETLWNNIHMSGQVILNEEMQALTYIRDNTVRRDLILINPKQFAVDPIYIPAITERIVYLASIGFSKQTGEDSQEKLKVIDKFFNQKIDENLLADNNIKYVYLLKEPLYRERYAHIINSKIFNIFFENEIVLILKFGMKNV